MTALFLWLRRASAGFTIHAAASVLARWPELRNLASQAAAGNSKPKPSAGYVPKRRAAMHRVAGVQPSRQGFGRRATEPPQPSERDIASFRHELEALRAFMIETSYYDAEPLQMEHQSIAEVRALIQPAPADAAPARISQDHVARAVRLLAHAKTREPV